MVSGATQVEINDYTFRLPSFVIFYYTIENMRLVSLTLLRVKLRHGQTIVNMAKPGPSFQLPRRNCTRVMHLFRSIAKQLDLELKSFQ
jgi:hypothetical protein